MLYTCPVCKKENLFSSEMVFHTNYNPRRCRECDRIYQKKIRDSKPDKIKEYKRKTKYGITKQDFDRQLQLQLNGCSICKQEFNEDRKPLVDHDHETNGFRCLVCHRCNVMLGYIENYDYLITPMIEYIKKYKLKVS